MVHAKLELDAERQVEGETVTAYLEVHAVTAVERLELLLDLPEGIETTAPNPQLLSLHAGERRELEYDLRCAHWGAYLSARSSSALRTASPCSSTRRRST